jgi:hypothetical protein
MLDGIHTITEVPTTKSIKFIVNNPVDIRDRNIPIFLDNTLATPVDVASTIQRTPIYMRESVEFLKENITQVQRINGIVTMTLASPHQFEYGTKVKITMADKKPAMMPVYSSAKKKSITTNTFKYDGDRSVLIIATTDDTISYADPKYTTANYNVALTRLNPLDLNKNFVEGSESRGFLRLYTKGSHGFNINDRIKVEGVDDLTWEYPRYNGNHRIYEVDGGTPFIVKKYEVVSDATYGTLIKFYVTKTNTLGIDRVINCREGDNFLIAGMEGARDYLNGTYRAIRDVETANVPPTEWVVTADGPSEPVALTTLTENPTLSVNGMNWIQYFPSASELRGALTKEPNTIFAVTNLKYTPAKGKTPNVVTITTNGRHLLNVGDSVKIELSTAGTDSKDQGTYGGTYTVTAINDADKFSYSLRTKKNDKTVVLPTVAVNQPKQGSVTRFKTNLEISKELVTARIISIATVPSGEAYKAYVYAPNHNLMDGDIIKIMFEGGSFKNLANDGENITVDVINENTFSYSTGSQISKNKQFPIVGVEFNSSPALKTLYPSDPNTGVANSIYYRLKGEVEAVNQPAVTANVISISSTGFGARGLGSSAVYTTVTCDQDLTNVIRPGAGAANGGAPDVQVRLSNLPYATFGTSTPNFTRPVITGFTYNGSSKRVVFTCKDPHGLSSATDQNTLFMLDSGPNYYVYPDFTDKRDKTISPGIYGIDMRSIYGRAMYVSRVSDTSFECFFGAFGSVNFTAKNLDKLNTSLTPLPTSPTLTGVSHSNFSMTLTFSAAHNLNNPSDVGASIDISGFASEVAAANNSTGFTLDTSWLNKTWYVTSIPNSNSVVVRVDSAKPSFSIFNIGSVGSPSTTTFSRRATTMSHASGKLTIYLNSPLPVTPNANTSVVINSMTSSASYPFNTSRVGGINTSVIPGTKTLNPTLSSSDFLVVDQSGYTPSFTIFGDAAASAVITVTQVSGGTFVPTPTVTATPNPISGASPLVSFLTYKPRSVQLTADLALYHDHGITIDAVSGNTFSFVDTIIPWFYAGGGGSQDVSSLIPKPTVYVPPSTWYDSDAPLLDINEKVSIAGMQDDYSFLNDFNLTILDYWPGPFTTDSPPVPTSYVRVANPYYTDSRKTMPPSKTSGLPDSAIMFGATTIPGTAFVVPRSSYSGAVEITRIARSTDGKTATITSPNHGFVVNDEVYVQIIGLEYSAFSQNYERIKIKSVSGDTFTYGLASNNNVRSFSGTAGVAVYGMLGLNEIKFGGSGAHNIVAGDTVSITGVSAYVNGESVVENSGVGSITISTEEPSNFTNRAATTGRVSVVEYIAVDAEVSGYVIPAPMAIREPQLLYRTYGEYPANSSIGGLTFSENAYSNKNSPTTPIFGSQLLTVAEILEGYSNTLEGFDYRVDVSLITNLDGTKTFNRKFVLLPIYPPTLTEYLKTLPNKKLAKGQVAHPKAFGADRLIFEYPGNISNVSMAENAESSATRVFVVGNDNRVGSGTEVAYSGASEVTLLADGWPLLDKKEVKEWPIRTAQSAYVDPINNYDDETGYYQYAERFLTESRPPVGDFVISINGSLNPAIGSYNPGDWCSIVINDNFIKTRLNSVLEPRKDVIVRKIDTIKVSVPNNPAFPEQINLKLVTDWQVDSIGK